MWNIKRFPYYKALLLLMLPLISNLNCNSSQPLEKLPDDPYWSHAFEKNQIKKVPGTPQIIASLKEPCKFPSIYLDNEKLYVIPRVPPNTCNINIYNRLPFSFLGSFGQKGEGPEEFQYISTFYISPDHLFIGAAKKVSYYTKNGKFIKERRKKPWLSPIPVKNNFAAQEYSNNLSDEDNANEYIMDSRFVLLDEDFDKIKELHSGKTLKVEYFNSKTKKKELKAFNDCFKIFVYKEKIFIGASLSNFFFSIFDKDGNNLYRIDKPVEKRPVIARDKEYLLNALKQRGRSLHYDTHFMDYYPAYKDFLVADDRIYVFMFPEGDLQQLIILDLKGAFIGSQSIPYDIYSDYEGSYSIKGKMLYYLEENLEKELWELKAHPILF